ncbi:hypothetical protein AHF37_05060 [Paragonimus kellicotti]|nr:hypothetical protein AHF37_05060 [Paragonimus kellicotti]
MDQAAANNAMAKTASQNTYSTQPVFIHNHTAINKRLPVDAGLCTASSSSSKWKFTGSQPDDAIQEVTVCYDGGTKQQRMIAKFEKDQNEIYRLQKSLASCQAEMGELLIDANRKKALVATLTKESAAKDSMLKQLDTALGRLTVEWKAREEQRQFELTRIKQSEQKSAEQLEDARRQFERSKNDWESKLEAHRGEMLKTFETTDAERIRQETVIRELKQKLTDALKRVNESEQLIANRESELEEARKQLSTEKERKRQLIAHCCQLQDEWKKQLTEAQSSLRRETLLLFRQGILHPKNIDRPIEQDSKAVTEIPVAVSSQQLPAISLKGLKAVYIGQVNPRYPEEDTTQPATNNCKAKEILTMNTISDEEESYSTDYSVVTEIHTAQYLRNSIVDTDEGGVTAEKNQSIADPTTDQRPKSLFSMAEALD